MNYFILATLYGDNVYTIRAARGAKAKKGDPGNTSVPDVETNKIQDSFTKTTTIQTFSIIQVMRR